MNVKIAFATVLWTILATMLFISPSFALVSAVISICILGGTFAVLSEVTTEEEKTIFSWVGIAASSILLLIVIYWGLIQ